MTKLAIAKTILAVIPKIDVYCEKVARKNYDKAISSMFSELQDTEAVIEQIIDKTYRAQQLHNLKIRVERQLGKAPKNITKAMDLHFIKGMPLEKTAKKLALSERTLERRLDRGVIWFTENLDRAGINYEATIQLFKSLGWAKKNFYLAGT